MSSQCFTTLEPRAEGPVARIWLDRPELRNAFDEDVIGELSRAFDTVTAMLRAMGPQAAQRYFLTAERFSAAEAHRIGLVHEVVAADVPDAQMDERVNEISSGY